MASSSAQQMRDWTGPAVLSFGFRPFFFLGSLWAALAMVLWVGMLAGGISLPMAFDPVDWHAHAFIIGYLGAIVSGFLLTAVPNWTGRLPVVGWRLGLLAALWIIGRGAMMTSVHLPPVVVALLDMSFLIALAAMLTREIVAGKNWRNLIVLVMLLALITGGLLFHWQAAQGEVAARAAGFRVMLGAAVMMISVIGGRIIPSFTRNWLAGQGSTARPVPPMARFDKATLVLTLLAILLWVFAPRTDPTGIALILAGLVQALRLSRWCGHHCLSEPLVWVLHAGYVFIPVGALALGVGILGHGTFDPAAGQHLWMAGAIGLMTLAVMTRATLGHTGRDLTAGSATTMIYLALIAAVLVRLLAGFMPSSADVLYALSGGSWCLAFIGFAVIYGPLLLRPRPTR
ncbi:NnrS family protein [uncultured Roseovarius sp.]|uniref:NnrS family protein n=1 Tax=uncultured Roseovarius sp. TaxID=293344 RepID=UPI00261FCBEF|nr:NnrS family protein [uncultured Roseovarius sp.]